MGKNTKPSRRRPFSPLSRQGRLIDTSAASLWSARALTCSSRRVDQPACEKTGASVGVLSLETSREKNRSSQGHPLNDCRYWLVICAFSTLRRERDCLLLGC